VVTSQQAYTIPFARQFVYPVRRATARDVETGEDFTTEGTEFAEKMSETPYPPFFTSVDSKGS
jgi:hypothetical protein